MLCVLLMNNMGVMVAIREMRRLIEAAMAQGEYDGSWTMRWLIEDAVAHEGCGGS
jgi:hypothetical protein